MNIAFCSSFRNATSYLARYFCQIRELNNLLEARGDSLNLILGEGDSTDGTRAHLGLASMSVEDIDCRIVDVSHGGKHYGSVVDVQRFKQLAYVCNRIWAHIPADSDVVIWMESDLTVSAEVMLALIDDLEHVPCVAPFIAELSTKGFYDCFAYRKDGKHFNKHAPYFEGWPATELVQVDSAGSLLVMNAELARNVNFTEKSVIVGLCEGIRDYGGSIWLDPKLTVTHR